MANNVSNWTTTTLGEFVTFQRGHDLPAKNMHAGQYPVIGSNGIIGWHDEYTNAGPSLSIGRSGNTGKPYYYEGAVWAHNTTLYVKDFHGNDPRFAYYFLQTLRLNKHAGGSAVPTLNRNHIHGLTIHVPDIETQILIASFLGSFDEAIGANAKTNDYLAA